MNNLNWLSLRELNTSHLNRNFGVLRLLGSNIAEKIVMPANEETIEVATVGNLIAARSATDPDDWIFGQSPAQDIASIRNAINTIPKESELVILAGSKAGYAAGQIAPLIKQNPQLQAIVLEPTAGRMRLCLSTNDLYESISSGRLIIALAPNKEESVWRTIDKHNLWSAHSPVCICFDGSISDEFIKRFNTLYQERSLHAQTRRVEALNSLKQSQPSTNQPIERVLLVDCWPGAPQQAHINALKLALDQRAIQNNVFHLVGFRLDYQPHEYRRSLETQLLKTVDEFKPQLIISYAYHAPQIMARELFDACGAPWAQVVSNIAYYDNDYYENEITAVIDKRLIPIYQKRGAPKTAFLPIMADYTSGEPTPTTDELPIVFVGNSLGLQKAERDYWLNTWKPRERTYNAIIEAERELSDFDKQLNLYGSLNENPIPDTENEQDAFQAFRYLLCQATAARRVQLLESIADRGLHIYGNWKHNLSPDSPLHGCLRGPLPMDQECALFKRGAIFINIHSVGHVTGPNMRFFNVAGMGGFLLSDGAFGDFLAPGEEYAPYTSLQELREQVDDCLNHPEKMIAVRQQGWQRVRQDWTYSNWLDWMSEILERPFAS